MRFLAPAFLAGLAALAIPLLIHLIHRERRVAVEFPSLMFLHKIPYRSVRRQKLRHLMLLAMRCLAIAILVAAFARPFLEQRDALAAAVGGAREIVVLLDRSYSMGYGDRWERARAAAREAVAGLGAADRATIVLFATEASVASEPTSDPTRLARAIDTATLSAEGTRYAPAIRLASQITGGSGMPRREVVLVSDFQRVGWARREEVSLPGGVVLRAVDVGVDEAAADVAVASVNTDRERGTRGAQDRMTAAARLTNVGREPRTVEAWLEVAGREVQRQRVAVPATGSAQVRFNPVPIPAGVTRGAVRITPDSLPQNDVFYFTVAPNDAIGVLVVEPDRPRTNQSLFAARALAIGERPGFRVDVRRASALTAGDLADRALVILNEVPPPAPSTALGARLRDAVEGGSGLLIVPGDLRPDQFAAWSELLPATIGSVVDRTGEAGGLIAWLDYSHPIFELFSTPRSGDFSTARVFRYRAFATRGDSGVVARFDDGGAALVTRPVGGGKVLMLATSLDNYWTDLPLEPVFLPFLHQVAKHAGRYSDARPWFLAGDVLDFTRRGDMTAGFRGAELLLEAPSGARARLVRGADAQLARLTEQGFYELRDDATPAGSGRPIAVNVDPAEADLSRVDPDVLIAAVTDGDARRLAVGDAALPTAAERERAQTLWWYLILLALLVLIAETVISNRLSAGKPRNTLISADYAEGR